MANETTPPDPGVYFTSEQLEQRRKVRAATRNLRIKLLAESLFGSPETERLNQTCPQCGMNLSQYFREMAGGMTLLIPKRL
jgi:hypothetical protein